MQCISTSSVMDSTCKRLLCADKHAAQNLDCSIECCDVNENIERKAERQYGNIIGPLVPTTTRVNFDTDSSVKHDERGTSRESESSRLHMESSKAKRWQRLLLLSKNQSGGRNTEDCAKINVDESVSQNQCIGALRKTWTHEPACSC